MKPRKFVIAAAGVVMALGATACGSSSKSSGSTSSGSSSSSGAYQVGFDSSLSGAYAANGTGERNGFNAEISYVNAHGGVNGHQVKSTVLDDAADVSTAAANETQLIAQHQVSAVAGGLLSNACGAAANIATAEKVPLICSAVATNLIQPVHPYVYSARNLQQAEGGPMVQFGKTLTTAAKPKVAIIVYGSAASSGLQTSLEQKIKAVGWDLVANINVPLTQSDVSAQASQIAAAHPDLVMGSLYDPLAVSFMRSLEAQHLNAPFLNYDGATLTGSLSPLKDPNYYMISSVTLTGQGSGAGLAQYTSAAQAVGAAPTAPFVNVGYLEALEVVDGLKSCGYPCSGAQLQKQLDKLNVNTAGFTTGPLTYSPTAHDTLNDFTFYHWNPSSNSVDAAASGLKGSAS